MFIPWLHGSIVSVLEVFPKQIIPLLGTVHHVIIARGGREAF